MRKNQGWYAKSRQATNCRTGETITVNVKRTVQATRFLSRLTSSARDNEGWSLARARTIPNWRRSQAEYGFVESHPDLTGGKLVWRPYTSLATCGLSRDWYEANCPK